jgi:hypothetical protein
MPTVFHSPCTAGEVPPNGVHRKNVGRHDCAARQRRRGLVNKTYPELRPALSASVSQSGSESAQAGAGSVVDTESGRWSRQKQHIAQDVIPASMQEHGRDPRDTPGFGCAAGVRNTDG